MWVAEMQRNTRLSPRFVDRVGCWEHMDSTIQEGTLDGLANVVESHSTTDMDPRATNRDRRPMKYSRGVTDDQASYSDAVTLSETELQWYIDADRDLRIG